MSALLGTLALALLVALGFALLTSLAAALAWSALRRRLSGWHPASRARTALLLAVAPAAVPLLLIGLCFAPGIASLTGLHPDHCLHHAGHAHLCLVHPSAPLSAPLAALLLAFAAVGLAAVARVARRVGAGRRAAARLRLGAVARPASGAPDLTWIESERAFSLTSDLGREIFVSSALAEGLDPAQLAAVVEHERAHARRRDGLRRGLARICSHIHLPHVRRQLLAELALATERCCDEEAGRRLGDRLRVAEAIVAVERLLSDDPTPAHPAFLAFGGSSVAERVRALLADPPPRGTGRAAVVVASLSGAAALALADPLHHVAEHLLGLLFGAH